MNKTNYHRKLEELIEKLGTVDDVNVPTVLLHSCCAPCSSCCIEYLSQYFNVTVFYYNPNIYPDEEYYHRVKEQKRFIELFVADSIKAGRKIYPVKFIEGDFEKNRFYEIAKGLEKEPEKGARCLRCYELRLRKTASRALSENFDFFCTTLSISPLKDAKALNDIGEKLEKELGVRWLPSDFKKNQGYLRSCEISKEYGMYRQNYCGCVYSVRTAEDKQV